MFVALRECRLRFGTVIKILPVFIFVLPGLRPNDPGLKGTDRKGLAQHRYKTLLHVRQSFVLGASRRPRSEGYAGGRFACWRSAAGETSLPR